ncbi:MAG: hypothetical protein IT223_05155 [Crocinitomicaceae bacterium]|nr:hypothetical protein [Crocinitomicaceae bacterium]
MTPIEIENKLNAQSYIEPEMLESTFTFWFTDHDHIRSPFPAGIREELRLKSIEKFLTWSEQISDRARKDINDEILAEKFEEIIFETGNEMVSNEDEKLTIKYPFMPRLNDVINAKDAIDKKAESCVIAREIYKKGDSTFMKIKLRKIDSGEMWETDFELPE